MECVIKMKNVQDYLEKGLYGTPQIKPDEKRRYLGTYRERVIFAINLTELSNKNFHILATKYFKEFPGGTLLVDANIPSSYQQEILKLTKKTKQAFKLVNSDKKAVDSTDIVCVYALDYAVNRDSITLDYDKIQKKIIEVIDTSTDTDNTKKNSFLSRLFGKK